MSKLNLFGGDKQETTYNTTQSYTGSYNTTLSSAKSLDNVGNTTIALPGSASSGGPGEYVTLAIAGLLLIAGIAVAMRAR